MKNFQFVTILVILFISASRLASQSITLYPFMDVYVDEQNPVTNFNSQGLLLAGYNVGPAANHKAICIKFDIPSNVTSVNSASLYLPFDTAIGPGDYNSIKIYSLNSAWDETTLTWNVAQTYIGSMVYSTSLWYYPMSPIQLPASLFQGWIANPSLNHGIMIVGLSVASLEGHFFDKENQNPANYPYLELDGSVSGPPPPPIAIIGPDTVCEYDVLDFSVLPSNNNYTYNWSIPSSWSIFMTIQNEITVEIDTISGQVCASLTNTNGTSTPICKFITLVSSLPDAGIMSGPDSVCVGETATYTLSPVINFNSYYWYVPTGWTIVSGQGTKVLKAIPQNYFASEVMMVSGFKYCQSVTTKHVTILHLPVPPNVAGSFTVLPNDIASYTANSTNATSYVWTFPPGTIVLSGDTTAHVTVQFGTTPGDICASGINKCAVSNPTCHAINILGIDNVLQQQNVTVFNTLNGTLKVVNHSSEKQIVSIFNEMGSLIHNSFEVAAQSDSEPMVAPGFYIVRCTSPTQTRTFKICISY